MLDLQSFEPIATQGAAFWPHELLDLVLETAAGTPGVYYIRNGQTKPLRVPRATWWRAFILAARDTGLPHAEIEAIRRSHVAPNGTCVITVGNGTRVLRFQQDTLAAMLDTVKPFEFPASRDSYERHWRSIAKGAGLSTKFLLTPKSAFLSRELETRRRRVETTDRPKTLLQFFIQFYVPLRLCGKSPRTRLLHETTIRTFELYLGREALLDDLTDLTVGAHLSKLLAEKKPATVEKERVQLLAVWRLACHYHFVDCPPNVPAIPVPERDPEAWLEHELSALFAAIDKLTGLIAGIPERIWWRALHLVIWDTGERISALQAIEWSDVDLAGGWLHVPAELRKGKRKDKTYKLHPETVETLKAMRYPQRKRVFIWPYADTYIWAKYAQILASAGLPHGRASKFHRMRRSVASHFERSGGNATWLLGHSRRSVTERAYLDPRIIQHKYAADVLFRPGEPDPSPPNEKEAPHEETN